MAAPPDAARVLILDDDPDLRDLIEDLYRRAGIDCVTAGSVAELQSREAAAMSCTLALLDVNLGPHQPTGVDACRWLRDHGFNRRIVFLTGHASSDPRVQQASQFDGTQVLTKPLGPERFLSLVAEPP